MPVQSSLDYVPESALVLRRLAKEVIHALSRGVDA